MRLPLVTQLPTGSHEEMLKRMLNSLQEEKSTCVLRIAASKSKSSHRICQEEEESTCVLTAQQQ